MISAVSNHLWQSTVFAIMAGLLTLAFRKNRAQVRYWLWFSASVKFLIPFSLLLTLGGYLGRSHVTRSMAVPAIPYTVVQVAEPFPADSPSAASPRSHGDWIPIAALSLWACGFAGIGLMRLRGWLRIRAALRSSLPMVAPFPVEVRSSQTLLEPGVVGFFRPILLCPAGIVERLTPSQLDAVLTHELCHVQRRDNLTAAVHMIVEAAFWFHPLVWWISARLMEERERACDEAVLELGSDRQVYAESILKTCQFCVESPLACVPGVTGADLKKRIVRIMTEHLANRLSFGRRLLLAVLGIAVIAGPTVFGLVCAPQIRAQAAQSTGGPLPSFEVASIRPGDPHGEWNLNAGQGGRLDATNITAKTLILIAYEIDETRLGDLPSWAQSRRFTIQAVGPPDMPQLPNRQMAHLNHQMLQSLLATRFSLRIHRATRLLPVYELVVAKGGPKLKVMNKADFVAAGLPYASDTSMIHWMPSKPQEHMTALGAAIPQLALALTRDLGRTVVDKTGLTGRYDFELTWMTSPGELGSLAGGPGFGGGAGADGNGQSTEGVSTSAADSSGPSIFTAIRDQLGLKLESTKGPVETIVIDHIERPSEN